MHPSCALSIFTVVHEQDPAQSSMLRICMREKAFFLVERPLARAESRWKAYFQGCSHRCAWPPAALSVCPANR